MTSTLVVEGVEIPEFLIAEEAQHHPSASPLEARIAAGKALTQKSRSSPQAGPSAGASMTHSVSASRPPC